MSLMNAIFTCSIQTQLNISHIFVLNEDKDSDKMQDKSTNLAVQYRLD